MVVPDTLFIAEILLYSVGFNAARNLAFKITRKFAIFNEALKYVQHYDFGLRTIKSVLVYAGVIKLRVINVKSLLDIKKEKADNRLSEHLNGIKRIVIKRKGKPKTKMSSGVVVRQ